MDKFETLANSVPDSGKEVLEMSEKIAASPAFVANFQSVCRHYRCTESEIAEMTIEARKDMTAAGESFANNALIIRGEWDGKYAGVAA